MKWLKRLLHKHTWNVTSTIVAYDGVNQSTFTHNLSHPYRDCRTCNLRQTLWYGRWIE